MFYNILKKKKGVTLVELLVSIAILAIVTAPFLGSFLSATRNNVSAERKLIASNLAQKAMEEIKADTGLLKTTTWTNYSNASDDNYYVEYQISKADEVTTDFDNYEVTNTYDISIYVNGDDTITIDSTNGEFDENQKMLEIYESSGIYDFEYSIDTDSVISSGFDEPSDSSIDILINFNYENPPSHSFMLDINASEDIEHDINAYIFDDKNNMLELSSSGKSINTYKTFTSSGTTIDSDSITLYDIVIRVRWKDDSGEVLNSIDSMVKK